MSTTRQHTWRYDIEPFFFSSLHFIDVVIIIGVRWQKFTIEDGAVFNPINCNIYWANTRDRDRDKKKQRNIVRQKKKTNCEAALNIDSSLLWETICNTLNPIRNRNRMLRFLYHFRFQSFGRWIYTHCKQYVQLTDVQTDSGNSMIIIS